MFGLLPTPYQQFVHYNFNKKCKNANKIKIIPKVYVVKHANQIRYRAFYKYTLSSN